MIRSRNWIKTARDGFINSQAIFCIYITYVDEENHWEVVAEDGEGEPYVIRECPDEEHAQRELQNTVDWLDGRG